MALGSDRAPEIITTRGANKSGGMATSAVHLSNTHAAQARSWTAEFICCNAVNAITFRVRERRIAGTSSEAEGNGSSRRRFLAVPAGRSREEARGRLTTVVSSSEVADEPSCEAGMAHIVEESEVSSPNSWSSDGARSGAPDGPASGLVAE